MKISQHSRDNRSEWHCPKLVQRFAEQLLTQQLWCFGQDVKAPAGNLLVRYGFERQPPGPKVGQGCTCYRWRDSVCQIHLWGFGLFYGAEGLGGVFLPRFDFHPRWIATDSLAQEIHLPTQLPRFVPSLSPQQMQGARQLTNRLLTWLADYEAQILEQHGVPYREHCLSAWSRAAIDPPQVVPSWRFLSRRDWELDAGDWQGTLAALSTCTSTEPRRQGAA